MLSFRQISIDANNDFGSIPCAELSHDVADVNLYRALGHVKLIGNALVRHSPTQLAQDLSFADGKANRIFSVHFR